MGLANYIGDMLSLQSIVCWTLSYFASVSFGTLASTDVLGFVIVQMHADGWGQGKGYVGLEDIVALQMTVTGAKQAPLENEPAQTDLAAFVAEGDDESTMKVVTEESQSTQKVGGPEKTSGEKSVRV